MKSAVLLAVVSLGLVGTAAGVAQAGSKMTDVDYLRANRCRGLAAGLGVSDTTSLDALIKTEGLSRVELIYERGQQELERAKREARSLDGKERLTAELNGPCTAYLSGGKTTASAR